MKYNVLLAPIVFFSIVNTSCSRESLAMVEEVQTSGTTSNYVTFAKGSFEERKINYMDSVFSCIKRNDYAGIRSLTKEFYPQADTMYVVGGGKTWPTINLIGKGFRENMSMQANIDSLISAGVFDKSCKERCRYRRTIYLGESRTRDYKLTYILYPNDPEYAEFSKRHNKNL